MNSKILGAALFFLLAPGWARAGNDGLAKLQEVPAGERVASYLQSYLDVVGAVVQARDSGGILGGSQTYRVVVAYDPDAAKLKATLVGTKQDPRTVRRMLEAVQKIILGLGTKVQKDFNVTLRPEDLTMDYVYAKSGKVLLRYRDGAFREGPESAPSATPVAGA